MADENANAEMAMDGDNLFKEEVFTDQRVGTIQRLTPVDADGQPTAGGQVRYVGQTQLMTRAGPLPLSFEIEAGSLKEAAGKFGAGAQQAITQYFFNSDAYFYFRDYCSRHGIDKPIYPGIMPIVNYANLARFSKNCGAEIPRWLHHRIEALGNDPVAISELGVEIISRLCETLLAGGAPGLHFYTMNLAEATTRICQNLGLCGDPGST